MRTHFTDEKQPHYHIVTTLEAHYFPSKMELLFISYADYYRVLVSLNCCGGGMNEENCILDNSEEKIGENTIKNYYYYYY